MKTHTLSFISFFSTIHSKRNPHALKFLLFIFLPSLLCSQTGAWTQKSTFPGGPRGYGVAGVVNGKAYCGLGYDGFNNKNDWYMYDPVLDTWTPKAAFPGSGVIGGVALSIGNKIYVGSGDSAWSAMNKQFWMYNPQNDTWTQRADFAGRTRYAAGGFAVNGKGYIATGWDFNGQYCDRDLWEYDTLSNSWAQKLSIPGGAGAPRLGAYGISSPNSVFLAFGEDSIHQWLTDLVQYLPASNSWRHRAALPSTPRFCSVGFFTGGKLYAGLGQDATIAVHHDFWAYDTLSNSWTQVASYPGGGGGVCIAFIINGFGYVYGGVDYGNLHYYDDMWMFDPSATGVLENGNPPDFSIFPCPFKNTFTICPGNSRNLTGIALYDVQGKAMEITTALSANGEWIVSTSGIQDGMYILHIETKQGVYIRKIIKQQS